METLKAKMNYLKDMQIDAFGLILIRDNKIIGKYIGKDISDIRNGQFLCSTFPVVSFMGIGSVFVAIVK